MQYDLHNPIVDEGLDKVDSLIKSEQYDEARLLLKEIESTYGKSGKLYLKKTKYHTCVLKFNKALEEYKEVNKSYIYFVGHGDEPTCAENFRYICKLSDNLMTEKQLIEYAKILTKNENYTVPKDIHYTFRPEEDTKITPRKIFEIILVSVVSIAFLILAICFPFYFFL